MSDDFWLYRWMDEFDVNIHTDPLTMLRTSETARQRLQEIAAEYTSEPSDTYDGIDNALVAGRDIDLSGDLDCCLDVSKIWQINENFPRLMHYFDKVILAGPSANLFAGLLEQPSERVLSGITTYIDGLAYLRDIGASGYVEFKPKVPMDPRSYKKWAKKFEIANVLDVADETTDRFAKEGTIVNLRQARGHWHFTFRHPVFEHDVRAVVWTDKKPSKKQMARAVFNQYAAMLTSDVISARTIGLPLGSNAELHASMLAGLEPESAVDEAALNLYLPVLDGLPLRDIIKLRQDEHDYFVKFQAAIRSGIKQQLETSGGDPERAAREVQKDIIDPALSDVYQRLANAEKSLTKKASLGVGIGSVLTMVGVIDAIPLVIGSGLAVAATAVAAAQSYFDAKKDIQNSDMYFLWLLEKQSQKHGRTN